MIKFKSFLSLSEALTDSQREYYNSLPRSPKAIADTDHFFGKGNDVITHQLENTMDKSEVHRKVERHLGQEIPHDLYKKGVVVDSYGRESKIGKILAKTKAPSSLINDFANDNTRQGKKFSGLSVVTTRSPGGDPSKGDLSGVAGQTSSNQSWENESCKNVDTGSNRKWLKPEIKHGTIVSYLKDHTGREIGRITLSPYHNNRNQTVYGIESQYGVRNKDFYDHVANIAKDLSGPTTGKDLIFIKSPHVYDDNKKSVMLHPNATPEDIDHILKSSNPHTRRLAMESPNVHPRHINDVLTKVGDKNWYLARLAAAKNPKATPDNLRTAMKDPNHFIRRAAVSNPNVDTDILDKALGIYSDKKTSGDEDDYVRGVAATNKNIQPYHLDSIFGIGSGRDQSEHVRVQATKNQNLQPYHIDKILGLNGRGLADPSSAVRSNVFSHPNIQRHHIDSVFGTGNYKDREPDEITRSAAITSSKATKVHLDKVLGLDGGPADESDVVRSYAMNNYRNATADHIERGMQDTSPMVRLQAALNPNATQDHIDRALRDPSPFVRASVMLNGPSKKIHPHHIEAALKDVNPDVRKQAYRRKKGILNKDDFEI